MARTDNRFNWLAAFLKREVESMRSELNAEKRKGAEGYKASEWLWNSLIDGAATFGGVKFAKRLTPDDLKRVSWTSLESMSKAQRQQCLCQVMNKTRQNVGSNTKGIWLSNNFETIRDYGGPAKYKKLLEQLPDARTTIAVMQLFDGVGPKLARNIFMGAYHRKFRDHVAVDERLKAVGTWVDKDFPRLPYRIQEELFRDLATAAGLDMWEVDRVTFATYGRRNGELRQKISGKQSRKDGKRLSS